MTAARVYACRLAPLLLCSAFALAASAKPVEREYDVEHLLVSIPDFDDEISLIHEDEGGVRRTSREAKEKSPEKLAREVERWVKAAIARPGIDAVPRVDVEAKRLRVTLEEADHRRLAGVLARDRVRQQTTVSLEARLLGGVNVADAPDDVRETLALAMLPGSAGVTLDGDEEVKTILLAAQAARESTVITAPRITLFNGQRAYVMTSTQRAYVKGYTRRPGDPAAEWQPDQGVASSGVLVDARPAVGNQGNVALALRFEFASLAGFKTVPFAGGPPGAKLEAQAPERNVLELETVTNVRDGGARLFYLGTVPDEKHVDRHHFLILGATVNPPAAVK